MKVIRDRSLVPPGGFKFKLPDGSWVTGSSFKNLQAIVALKMMILNIPVPHDLRDQIEAQLCEQHSNSDYCIDNENGKPRKFSCESLTPEQVWTFSKTMIYWHRDGGKLVSDQEANHRAEICNACPQNKHLQQKGCSLCMSGRLRNMVVEHISKKRAVPHQENLFACGVCCCEIKALVWMPLDILEKGHKIEPDAFPTHCWRRHES